MKKFKLIYQALTVFLPILVKGIYELWKELNDAYSDENIKYLENISEANENVFKNITRE